jgi:hypothetical protein
MLMIAKILYTKDAPHEREVDHFIGELAQLRVPTEKVEADSREGIAMTENYDLMQRPALALLRDDGSVVQQWQGELPTTADVSYLAHQ